MEAVAMAEELFGKRLNSTYKDDNRVGDHIWWVSDVSKFKAHYPGWDYRYGIRDIIREIGENVRERL